MISGEIRGFGVSLLGVYRKWGEAFRKIHPGVRFVDNFSNASAIAGLYTGVCDIGVSGREPVLTEYFSFYETFKYLPTEIAVATGAFDVKGGSYGLVVYVHRDNPLAALSMEQLDGVFGSERNGGYVGLQWMPQAARGADKNIRTWGQLGLGGEWKDKPIQTYGYALTGMTVVFQQKVFQGGDKWNPNYRQYIESRTKQVGDERMTIDTMFKELSADRYGMAWTGMWQAKGFPNVKTVALAPRGGAAPIAPTRASFSDGSYPLNRNVYLFVNRKPGQPLPPHVAEFLRFVLSREGQQIVDATNVYFSLAPALVQAQLAKIG